MVWPATNQNPLVETKSNVTLSSSLSLLAPQPRQSINRFHRIASPPPPHASSSSNTPASQQQQQQQQDWHHHRQQQQSLDLIPFDLPPQSQHVSAASQSTSASLPSTAPPHGGGGLTTMPGSFYSDPDSRASSPSSEDEGMFRLAHDPSPPWRSTTSPRLLPPSQDDALRFSPFQPIPSAQPRSAYPSSSASSPPPFTNMSSFSTQAASFLPSPPNSQHERRLTSPPLSIADSQPTLRQGHESRQLSSPPTSPIQRPQVGSHRRSYSRDPEETDVQALNAVVDGIGRMQVHMNLDRAGRWRIARRNDSSW